MCRSKKNKKKEALTIIGMKMKDFKKSEEIQQTDRIGKISLWTEQTNRQRILGGNRKDITKDT